MLYLELKPPVVLCLPLRDEYDPDLALVISLFIFNIIDLAG